MGLLLITNWPLMLRALTRKLLIACQSSLIQSLALLSKMETIVFQDLPRDQKPQLRKAQTRNYYYRPPSNWKTPYGVPTCRLKRTKRRFWVPSKCRLRRCRKSMRWWWPRSTSRISWASSGNWRRWRLTGRRPLRRPRIVSSSRLSSCNTRLKMTS
jgi:hypothetical protein